MSDSTAGAPPVAPLRRRWTVVHEAALIAVVALVQLGATTLAARHGGDTGTIGATGYALLAAGVAALPLRHRHPVGVLAWVLTATAAYSSLGYPDGPIFGALLVAFVHTVVVGRRRAAIASLVVGFFAFTWLEWLIGRGDAPGLAEIGGLAAWLVTLFSVTEVVRSRREKAGEQARSQAEAVRRQAADERVRIARELHDAVAHNMSLINIQAGVALHLIDDQPDQVRGALEAIKGASKEALVELRSILGVLRQVDDGVPRAPTPTLRRLDDLVDAAALTGVDVTLEVVGDIERLPRGTDLAAYRIVQESLVNVARHSDRPDAAVRIRADDGTLTVEVLDEGSGHRPSRDLPTGGNGIPGMRERAASVGGWLDAGPRPGRGFAVRAELPMGDPS